MLNLNEKERNLRDTLMCNNFKKLVPSFFFFFFYQSQIVERKIRWVLLEGETGREGGDGEIEIGETEDALPVVGENVARFRVRLLDLVVELPRFVVERHRRASFQNPLGRPLQEDDVPVPAQVNVRLEFVRRIERYLEYLTEKRGGKKLK